MSKYLKFAVPMSLSLIFLGVAVWAAKFAAATSTPPMGIFSAVAMLVATILAVAAVVIVSEI